MLFVAFDNSVDSSFVFICVCLVFVVVAYLCYVGDSAVYLGFGCCLIVVFWWCYLGRFCLNCFGCYFCEFWLVVLALFLFISVWVN